MRLRCIRCDAIYPPDLASFACRCGGSLDVEHDLESLRGWVNRDLFDSRLGSTTAPFGSGVWRYAELIYPAAAERAVTAPEGNTNLYQSPELARWVGLDGLRIKHEGENPTGSFKDRGMTVGVTHAREVGATTVACASTGNTSSSLAAYAARAGIASLVFIPHGSVALGKLSQTVAYGARTVEVRGDFDAAMKLVAEVSLDQGIYLLNSVNPFRLEGQKSIVFEIIQQLGWSPPDWIVLPGGNLGNTSAFGKGLWELKQLGLIDKLPRLAVIQAAGANPFYRAYRAGFGDLVPVRASTVATAIKIGNPVNYAKARRSLQWTDGVAEEATDEEIMDAKARVDATGIGCEPASAASIAGLKTLVAKGVIRRDESAVAVLTGHLLKDPDSTIMYHLGGAGAGEGVREPGRFANRSAVIEPSLDEVLRLLRCK